MTQRRALESAAGILALVVAGVHLYWGIPRFVAYASVGTMADPRPLAFVLSGHAIVVALTLIPLGIVDSRRAYAPGMALMVVHLVSYAAWHTVLDHGVPGATAAVDHGHSNLHLGDALFVVLGHVVNSPLVLVSKLAEFGVLILLASLYVSERGGQDEP